MAKYGADYPKLGTWILPAVIRKTAHAAWVRVILGPMAYLNGAFQEFIGVIRLEQSYNFQTRHIERMLNDKYPAADNGIYIEDAQFRLPRLYGFYKAEGQPALDYGYYKAELEPAPYGYYKEEYSLEYDFIVKVPDGLAYQEAQMRAFINRYKLSGKRYIIETYA